MGKNEILKFGLGAFIVLILIAVLLIGCPAYRVYNASKTGESELQRASFNRQIQITEAHAKFEAAALLASADTIRAHGVARSNEIIGKSITPEYLNYLWLQNMEHQDKSVMYVPSGNLGMPLFFNQNVPKP